MGTNDSMFKRLMHHRTESYDYYGIKYFKETVVPIMATRGATSAEMVQTENDLFLATAIYPDKTTADANPEEIQALRKGIIEAFNLNTMDAYGGTSVVGI